MHIMKTQIPNNSDLKLHELNNKKLEEIHLNELGLKIPDNYFSDSKKKIIGEILNEKTPKVIPFYRQKRIWYIAASMLLLFGLTFVNTFTPFESENKSIVLEDTINKLNKEPKQDAVTIPDLQSKNKDLVNSNKLSNNSNTPAILLKEAENDILIKSLFIEDHEVNEYVTNYMLEEI